jgi:hypothetical protein
MGRASAINHIKGKSAAGGNRVPKLFNSFED